MKKNYIISIMILFCMSIITGCGLSSTDNPLFGKNTDERIIMCLEIAYPEHKFAVVESYDEATDSGIYVDENGLEFEVHDIVYNNSIHFGCSDEYLSTILKNEDYVEKATTIVERYNQELSYNEGIIGIYVSIEDIETGKLKMDDVAQMVLKILNCVETPEVVLSDSAGGFSTNEINYYCEPTWGRLVISFKQEEPELVVGGHICFSQKNASISSIQQELEEIYMNLEDDFWY